MKKIIKYILPLYPFLLSGISASYFSFLFFVKKNKVEREDVGITCFKEKEGALLHYMDQAPEQSREMALEVLKHGSNQSPLPHFEWEKEPDKQKKALDVLKNLTPFTPTHWAWRACQRYGKASQGALYPPKKSKKPTGNKAT